MIKELQFDKKFYMRMLIVVMVFSAGISLVNVYDMIGSEFINLSMLDYYVINLIGGFNIENIISWLTPIFLATIIGYGYNFYRRVDVALFTRVNQSSFIYKKAIKSFLIGFVFEFLFYVLCFFYTIILCLIINSNMRFGVSFDLLERTIVPSLYYNHPILYLGWYIIFGSIFGGLFALISFYCSLITKNKIIIFLSPFIYIVINIFICEIVPYGHYFNYNNLNILDPTTYAYYGGDLLYIFLIPLSILLQLLFFSLLIKIKGKSDLC